MFLRKSLDLKKNRERNCVHKQNSGAWHYGSSGDRGLVYGAEVEIHFMSSPFSFVLRTTILPDPEITSFKKSTRIRADL